MSKPILRANRRGPSARFHLAAFATLAGAAVSADAQVINWNAGSGGWASAANWLPVNVPDTIGEDAVLGGGVGYIVSLSTAPGISPTIGALSITNPLAVLHINVGRTLALNANSLNNGIIRINPDIVGGASTLRFDQSVTLSGSGQVRLNTNGANSQVNTALGATLTQAAGHSIVGGGHVNAAITNNGSILADDSIGQTNFPLVLLTNNKANNAVMGAAASSELLISGITITQSPSGSIQANGAGALISTASATIIGGAVTASGGGLFATDSGTTILESVTLDTPTDVLVGDNIDVRGTGLINNGLLRINPAVIGGATSVEFIQNGTLSGTGEVRLVSNAANSQLNTAAGVTITHAAGHTIRGVGQVNAAITNNGSILADDSVGQNTYPLVLQTSNKTNNAVMGAAASSELLISGITITQSPTGTIQASGAGALISTASATIIGGAVTASGGGLFATDSGTTVLESVTLNTPTDVLVGDHIDVRGTGLINNGLLRINPQVFGGGTTVEFIQNGTLGGTGEVRLVTNGGNSQLNSAAGVTITHAAGHTIRGVGHVNAAITNNGDILADDSVGQDTFPLVLQGSDKTNNATMRAATSSDLRISGITITQTPGASIQANGAGAIVSTASATIIGGAISASGGGLFSTDSGVTVLESVTLNTPTSVNVGDDIHVRGTGLVNNGLLRINPQFFGGTTNLQFNETGTLGGTGTLELSTVTTNSRLVGATGAVITHTAPHAITGVGQISVPAGFINQSLISPALTGAAAAGTINVVGEFTNGAAGVLDFELGGIAASQFDRFTGSADYNLGGTLDLSLLAPYVPVRQHTMRIIAGASVTGRFDTIIKPALPAGVALRVIYHPTTVDVWFHCPPDLTTGAVQGVAGYGVPNGTLNNDDFFYYLAQFAAGDVYIADLTTGAIPGSPGYGVPNGILNNEDFFYYLAIFSGGC